MAILPVCVEGQSLRKPFSEINRPMLRADDGPPTSGTSSNNSFVGGEYSSDQDDGPPGSGDGCGSFVGSGDCPVPVRDVFWLMPLLAIYYGIRKRKRLHTDYTDCTDYTD